MRRARSDGRTRDRCLEPVRLPRGGWGFSTLAVLDDHQIVLDEQYSQYAELQVIPLRRRAGPAAVRG